MKSTEINNYSYYESSTKIRPGTYCYVTTKYRTQISFKFNSNIENSYTLNGYFEKTSISFDKDVNIYEITIKYNSENDTTLIEMPIMQEDEITCTINKIDTNLELKQAFSAFDNKQYYNLYEIIDGYVTPCSIIEYTRPENAYYIDEVNIEPVKYRTGIEYLNSIQYNMFSDGILVYNEDDIEKRELVLAKGIKTKKIHKNLYSGPYIKTEGEYVHVEYQDNSLQEGFNKITGILFYDKWLLVLTNKGMCVFDRFTKLEKPLLFDNHVLPGNDITIDAYDNLYVTYKNKIYKYHIRHDFVYINRAEKRVYLREDNPHFDMDIIG